MFTPQVEVDGVWQRVRVHDVTRDRGLNRVYLDGTYPLVENGAEVTAETPRVRLSGFFDAADAPCGLGCRCDATITPQPGSVAERVTEKDVWVVGQDVVLVGLGVRYPQPGVSVVPGRVTRVSTASVWVEAPGQVGAIRFTWKTPKRGRRAGAQGSGGRSRLPTRCRRRPSGGLPSRPTGSRRRRSSGAGRCGGISTPSVTCCRR